MGTWSGNISHGSHYYVTFIDDVNAKTWVYCIRNKADVSYNFKK